MAEALEGGEGGQYLTPVSHTLTSIANDLETELTQWIPHGRVTPELRANAHRLRDIATALADHAATVEHLINGDGDDPDI
ncbi:hypothetical protein [Nocardia sp. NBC_01327]|uniref:hypothetical protein n=1 Tax=Nocardia sp. NBC_01327 TaxID=2903593 RepID=UPI002E13A6DB|nr:hypothetical protein OG326_42875 [Nocardia sp. NBC_01327]